MVFAEFDAETRPGRTPFDVGPAMSVPSSRQKHVRLRPGRDLGVEKEEAACPQGRPDGGEKGGEITEVHDEVGRHGEVRREPCESMRSAG